MKECFIIGYIGTKICCVWVLKKTSGIIFEEKSTNKIGEQAVLYPFHGIYRGSTHTLLDELDDQDDRLEMVQGHKLAAVAKENPKALKTPNNYSDAPSLKTLRNGRRPGSTR